MLLFRSEAWGDVSPSPDAVLTGVPCRLSSKERCSGRWKLWVSFQPFKTGRVREKMEPCDLRVLSRAELSSPPTAKPLALALLQFQTGGVLGLWRRQGLHAQGLAQGAVGCRKAVFIVAACIVTAPIQDSWRLPHDIAKSPSLLLVLMGKTGL